MNKKNLHSSKALPTLLVAVLCAVTLCSVVFMLVLSSGEIAPVSLTTEATEPPTTEPPVPVKEKTVTLGSAGDVLIHMPILNSASLGDGEYSFDNVFTYVSSTVKDCDYFVANLETTLAGTAEGRKYSGYPCFNSPASLLDSLKKSGFDCLLTANNHTYDTGAYGVKKTLEELESRSLDHVGTRSTEEEKSFLVKNIGGISFGIGCYTYETENENGKALNGIYVDSETARLINSFDYTNIEAFYTQLSSDLKAMKAKGAEVTVIYLHWGNEYQLTPDSHQTAIAQRLCDMGVDVIIGGHPHVVQPVELFTSSDGKHKTVCVYSVGNMLSNQRRNLMGLKTGHTEDGLIFKMTFSKYSDGTVVFEKVKAIPTWVHLYSSKYRITPLSDDLDSKADKLGLTQSSSGLALAKESYKRTMDLVGEGVKECNKYLSSIKTPEEIYYETATTLSQAA